MKNLFRVIMAIVLSVILVGCGGKVHAETESIAISEDHAAPVEQETAENGETEEIAEEPLTETKSEEEEESVPDVEISRWRIEDKEDDEGNCINFLEHQTGPDMF